MTTSAASQTDSNIRAILLMAASMVLFAIDDAAIKLAGTLGSADGSGGEASPGEIIMIKGILGGLVYGAMMLRDGEQPTPAFIKAIASDKMIAARTAGDLLAAMAIITGLTLLPLSELSAVLQVQPLVITVGAAIFLKETVGWRRWTAILIGFAGVMIIIRPSAEGYSLDIIWAFLAVLGLATRDLVTRQVKTGFSTFSIVTYVAVLLIPMGLVMHLVMENEPLFQGLAPAAWAFVIGGGVFGMAGYYAITLSLRMGEISAVAPYRYTRLVAALILGFLVFREVPDTGMIIGSIMVIGAGLFTLYREQQIKKAQRQAS
ncbi:MAG: DMT family transporter [Pseudomonadota bacterium]